MESESHLIFDEMRKAELPLATWEMKGLRAGPIEAVISVGGASEKLQDLLLQEATSHSLGIERNDGMMSVLDQS